MKTKNYKRPIALFLAVVLCAAMLFSLGTTAFAAGETEDVCLIAFPRDGDENYSGEWGHGNLNFMNGWSTKASAFTLIRAMGQYSGNICYCIEPGVSQQPGDSLTKKGEDFWDNYPAAYNKTISPEDIKLLIGRIFQYGYTGPISVSWRSQNDGGDKLAHAVATQLLIWETVVGERDADFNKIGTNGKDAIVDQISTNHPLYGQIMGYYSSIAANVQYHSSIPSFLSKTAAGAQTVSLEWTGETYAVTLTDKNGVLSAYSFSSSNPDIKFSVKGNKLTISTAKTLNEPVAITAEKSNSRRSGVITWTDGVYGPNGKLQDTVTYAVKTTTDPNDPQEVATVDDAKKAILKDIFWQMNEISSHIERKPGKIITETDDGHGNIVETITTVTHTYLYITVSHKTAEEMADRFNFNADQRQQLSELLVEENRSMWSAVLYGIYSGDDAIVTVALSQIGNVGGQPYWSWYGFNSRVEWCACFVSWCANECGYIDSGVIPKFAGCVNGVQWFKDRGQWQDGSFEPSAGQIIFFDWDNKGSSGPQDGQSDHVGIVEKCENGIVYTIEGNSGDSCRQRQYPVGYYEILGYGIPE